MTARLIAGPTSKEGRSPEINPKPPSHQMHTYRLGEGFVGAKINGHYVKKWQIFDI